MEHADVRTKPRPLAGVRIIELGSLIAGPFAAHLLADFGAEVIKVEPPGKGDELRTWRYVPPGVHSSLWWYYQARNKKGVTLDLRQPEGQALLRRLARLSDAVIENFRPGTLARWGLAYEDLRRENPRLIMVSVSGYGQTGPYKAKPGFASVAEGVAGIRHLTGFPDRPPVRVGVSLGDHIAGMYAALGLLLALYHRDARGAPAGQPLHDRTVEGRDAPAGQPLHDRTVEGRDAPAGQHVDVALYESIFTFTESLLPEYDVAGRIWERVGTALLSTVPSNTYPTADDRWVIIGANNDNLFHRLTAAMGCPEVADDPRYADNQARIRERERVDGMIAEWTRRHTLEEVVRILEEAQVPVGPIYTAAEIVKDPQYQARDMLLAQHVPGLGPVKFPGIVPKLSETPGGVDASGPALGEHNRYVYGELLGLSEEELADLARKGVI